MSSVAEQLRAAREQKKWTVHQVAEATKIKTDHVRALEECDWGVFSAPVYIRGFFRSYASHLKLDVPRLMVELEAELSKTREFSEPPCLAPRARGPIDFIMLQISRVKWQLIFPLLLTVAVGFAIYYGFKSFRDRPQPDPLGQLGPGIYQPAATKYPAAPIHLPLPTNPPPPRR